MDQTANNFLIGDKRITNVQLHPFGLVCNTYGPVENKMNYQKQIVKTSDGNEYNVYI